MSSEGRCVLLLDQFGTPYPSLCDATPYGLILAIPRDFRHKLAFGGKSQKPFRRVHWPTSVRSPAYKEANSIAPERFRSNPNKSYAPAMGNRPFAAVFFMHSCYGARVHF